MGCCGGSEAKRKRKRRRDKSRLDQKCSRHRSLSRPHLCQDDVGRVIVSLSKREGSSLGLTVSGGIDKGECPVISQIRPASIADRADALLINDQLVAVNGVRTASLKHEEIISLVKNAGPKLLLEIQYALPAKVQTQTHNRRRVEVVLAKEIDGYGFVARGGKCADPERTRPLTVMHIRPGGAAERDGRLKVGDRITSINGIQLSNSTCEEVYSILRNSEGEIAVWLEYDITAVGRMPPTVRPLSISIEKFPNEDLGISLTAVCSSEGKRIICIQGLREAGIAERCGAFKIGDQLVAVDDIRLDGLSLSEASKLIRENKGRQIKLEIIPTDHQRKEHRPASESPHHTQALDGTLPQAARPRPKPCSTVAEEDPYVFRRQQSLAKSTLSIQSTPYLPVSSIFHVETTIVELAADDKGSFGFTMKGIQDPTAPLLDYPVVEFIEPFGPAHRLGVVCEGDRIIEVNDMTTLDRSMDAINSGMMASEAACRLKLQFDVASAVVPRSGVFCVKLPKSGGGIGITLKSEQNHAGDSHLISSVKSGSPAHRSGSIEPGDRLLAIDNFSTNQTTIEEAAMILQNAGDIVTLKIQKNTPPEDIPNSAEEAIFEVEINRPEPKAPLGITISGTDEPFEPITVDSLTTGGLAEMSRKLRPDDQVLAINGTPLYGRTVNEVLDMLKHAGLRVHLKVARHTSYINSQVAKNSTESENDSEESSGRGTGNYLSTFRPQGSSHTRKAMSLPSNVLTKKIPSKDSAVDMGEPLATESDSDSHTSPRVQVHVTHNALYEARHGPQDSIEEEAEEYTLEQLQHISCPGCREAIINELRQRPQRPPCSQSLRQSRSESRLGQHSRSRSEAAIAIGRGDDSPEGGVEEHAFALSLHRSSERENFGIGVSDGLSEKGVFISAIQRDSPAERCTLLQLYDRILRVNGVDTSEMCCKQVVGLIGRSTNRLDLVLLRRQTHNFADDECVPYRSQ